MVVLLLALICSFKLVMGKQEGFIVGGAYVNSIKDFPHVAYLSLVSKKGQYHLCGSSILNQIILITAAHCLDDIVQVTAFVGDTNREKGRPYRASTFIQHKQWNTKSLNNDIALCKLKNALSLGHAVKRVVMVMRPPTARIAELAGWGAIEEKDYSETDILKHTVQKLWSYKQCKEIVALAPKGTICGGEIRARGNFASIGDSGSALLVNKNILVGVVSFKDTSISRSLVVYTDVAYFYDWIMIESKRLACS